MFNPFGDSEVGFENPGRSPSEDSAWLFAGSMIVALALLFPFISNRASNSNSKSSEPPGNVMIEARWPDQVDTDVDLWVQAPGDVPVGYSNKGGAVFNLLRDDLGDLVDATKMNYEVAYARGAPAGEYTVNVHLYRSGSAIGKEVPVTVVASTKLNPQESTKQILTTTVLLTREGQEITAFRFTLDSSGKLVSGSVNSIPKPLRDWKSLE